jgi:hypothetical protein
MDLAVSLRSNALHIREYIFRDGEETLPSVVALPIGSCD